MPRLPTIGPIAVLASVGAALGLSASVAAIQVAVLFSLAATLTPGT